MENQEQNNTVIEPVEIIAAEIRKNAKAIKLTRLDDFFQGPHNMSQEILEQALKELESDEGFNDIKHIEGSSTRYFYCDNDITDNYAKMLAMVEDKDLFKMIAETVRHESKTYPRPTAIKLFTFPPFSLEANQMPDLLRQLKGREEYKDIQEVKASNGAIYLYSNGLMTKAQAASIAEWTEVLRFENP